MREPRIVAEYVESLARKLSFDPPLSHRVRREVEDHLLEAVGRTAPGNEGTAAAQAIARFGDPQRLAAEFATARLAERTRQVSASSILLVAATLLAMKARLAWYGVTQWQLDDALRALAATIGMIDACVFWLAVALTVSGWIYLIGRSVPASNAAQCQQLRHVVRLNFVSAAALTISVMCDAALTALRLFGQDMSAQWLIPLSSMMAEIALTGILIIKLGGLISRMTRTSSLLSA